MYALADCNNFFVSCERVFRPDLRDKPVLVMSGNDGCVISRSNEVKELGIKMGVPMYQIRQEVSKFGITCFSSNFALYGDLSHRVMSLLGEQTTKLEQYSIDEAFMHIEHITREEQKTRMEQVRKDILRGVGIPLSIGIAKTKTIAKIASKFAKQYAGYNGVCEIVTEAQRRRALQLFPVADVWGIGRQSQAKLSIAGIKTAWDLAEKSEEFVYNLLGKTGWQTWRELNGQDCIALGDLPQKQSITRSRTFAEPIQKREEMEKYIADFTSTCAEKLRQQHAVCKRMVVYAHTSRFRTDIPQKYIQRQVDMPVATSTTAELLSYALQALRSDWEEGILFKQAGVILTSISPDKQVEQDLFDTRNREKEEKLQHTIDRLSSQWGKATVQAGVQIGKQSNKPHLKTDYLSPCYSTNLHDIITVKC